MDEYIAIQTTGLGEESLFSRDNIFEGISIFLGIVFLIILIVAIFSKSTVGFLSKIKKNALLLLSLINVALIFIYFIQSSLVVALYGPEYGDWGGPVYVPTMAEKIKGMFLMIPRLAGNILVLPIILAIGLFQSFKKKSVKQPVDNTNKP